MIKIRYRLNSPNKSLPRIKELYNSIEGMGSFVTINTSPRQGYAMVEGSDTAIKKFKKGLEKEYIKSQETE